MDLYNKLAAFMLLIAFNI